MADGPRSDSLALAAFQRADRLRAAIALTTRRTEPRDLTRVFLKPTVDKIHAAECLVLGEASDAAEAVTIPLHPHRRRLVFLPNQETVHFSAGLSVELLP